MPKPHIEVEGAKALRKTLTALGDDLADIKSANKDGAELVASEARHLVPVRSGKLRDSIRALGAKTGSRVAAGKKTVPYAAAVHFGWPSRPNAARGWRGGPIPPNPFLYDAADKRADDVVALYEQRVAELTQKVNDQ